jgi:hypothetical protein
LNISSAHFLLQRIPWVTNKAFCEGGWACRVRRRVATESDIKEVGKSVP